MKLRYLRQADSTVSVQVQGRQAVLCPDMFKTGRQFYFYGGFSKKALIKLSAIALESNWSIVASYPSPMAMSAPRAQGMPHNPNNTGIYEYSIMEIWNCKDHFAFVVKEWIKKTFWVPKS